MVSLFILGRVYIANAGDSRVVEIDVINNIPISTQMSFDFTPESEQKRIRKLAEQRPDLLGGEYTWREYQKQPCVSDLGKPILYKDAFMTGWASKILTLEDLKMPIISGEGKRVNNILISVFNFVFTIFVPESSYEYYRRHARFWRPWFKGN